MAMRPKLVKPYFFLDWDDDERIRVEAKKADIDRFLTKWPEIKKSIDELREKEEDPDEADVKAVKKGFNFLLGEKLGKQVYKRCMDEVRGDEADELSEVDCIYQLLPTLSYIADEWTAHALSMSHQRDANVERYLQRVQGGQPL